jgi:hypothetical protein
MGRIRAEVFGADYTDFALVEELELFVAARHGGMETAVCRKRWLSLSLAFLLILLTDSQHQFRDNEAGKAKMIATPRCCPCDRESVNDA